MVCKNCGNEIRDGAAFCPHCGAVTGGEGTPVNLEKPAPYTGPEGPVSGGDKGRRGLLIGGAIAVAVVVAVVAVIFSGLFSNPKGQVEKALAKTVAAFQTAEEKLGMPDTAQWQKDQTVHQEMSLALESINSQLVGYDLSALSGLGLYLTTDYNGPGRQLYFDMGARWGEDDLLSFQAAADDAIFSIGSPQFLGSDFYGVNTETIGQDMAALTGDPSIAEASFNLFDLMDMALERFDPEVLEEAVKQANQTLWQEVEVRKTGAITMDVNGTETKTTAYRAVIPQEALDRYVDNMTAILSDVSYYDLYADIFQAAGMPQEEIDEFLDTLEELDPYGQLADGLHELLEGVGDVELEVCLSGGYISAVRYVGTAYGSPLFVALYLGGGAEYVDDLSLELEAEGVSVEWVSTGDHSLSGGTFTDKTTIRVRENGASLAKVTSELSYAPGGGSGNFQWELGVNASGLSVFTLETAGTLDTAQDAISLELDQVSLRAMGMEVCTLSFAYTLDKNPAALAITPRLITELSEEEAIELMDGVETNAYLWLFEMQQLFTSRLPQELLRDMLYGF